MNSYEPEPNLDAQLKKLESHIRHLPRPSLPPEWKQDILAAAKPKEHAPSAVKKETPHRKTQPAWLSVLTEMLQLITPVRATVAAIWLLALCGSSFDTWLNGSRNTSTTRNTQSTPYTSLSDQLMQWELAGLDPNSTEKETSPQTHQETPPGPRSHRKQNNHSPFTLHHS